MVFWAPCYHKSYWNQSTEPFKNKSELPGLLVFRAALPPTCASAQTSSINCKKCRLQGICGSFTKLGAIIRTPNSRAVSMKKDTHTNKNHIDRTRHVRAPSRARQWTHAVITLASSTYILSNSPSVRQGPGKVPPLNLLRTMRVESGIPADGRRLARGYLLPLS